MYRATAATLALVAFFSIWASSSAKADDTGYGLMPSFLDECESPNSQPHCGVTWSFSGDHGIMLQGNIKGELLYKWIGVDTVEIDRVDVIPGGDNFTAVYKGHFDGKSFSGTVVWYEPGVSPPGGVTGTWHATPSPPPADFAASLPQTNIPEDQFVRQLFAAYEFPLSEEMTPPNPTGANADKIFEPGLLSLIQQDISEAQAGNSIILDFDPICLCQDWDSFQVTTLQVRHLPIIENVVVKFDNEGKAQQSILKLIHTSDGWRIQDIQTDTIPSLRQLLSQRLNSEKASQFITLSATKLQQTNCNSDRFKTLAVNLLQLELQNGAAASLRGEATVLGGASGWKLLGVTGLEPLNPVQALEPQLSGTGNSEILTALGPYVHDAGKEANFQGDWMMCEVDFNLQWTRHSSGELPQTSQQIQQSIVLVPSDGPSGVPSMALFGVTQAELRVEMGAIPDDPALMKAIQQGVSRGLGQ